MTGSLTVTVSVTLAAYVGLDVTGTTALGMRARLATAPYGTDSGIRLLDTGSGFVLWSDHFDGTVDGYFGFEDRVAFAVSAYVDAAVQTAAATTSAGSTAAPIATNAGAISRRLMSVR